jgi:arginase
VSEPRLVRVPRAWGSGGESMAAAAQLPLPFGDAATIEEDTLAAEIEATARVLPERPVVLGGCCCSHVGAAAGLSARHDDLAIVWFDAHGDLNTPETSPSGNEWGMPLRMILDAGYVRAARTTLLGARNLDPPEVEFIREAAIRTTGLPSGNVYVAFDLDVLDPADAVPFMPEPDGMRLAEAEALLESIAARTTVVGAGFTGATPDPANVAVVERLAAALHL